MSQPTPYERLYSFTDWQTVNPSRPLPGSEVDAELNAVKLTSDQTRANLALIQRDDGRLANQSVTPESLSAGALAMISQGEYVPRGTWVTATAYAVGDLVEFNAATYLCLIAHTSATFGTDLTAAKWLLIANGALSGGNSALDLFTGDAVETVFTLSYTYAGSNAATVYVGGVAQIPVQDFTIVGTQLTLIVPPPAPGVPGAKNVMVRGTGVEAQLAADQAVTQAANALASADDSADSAAAALVSENAAAASASTASTQAGIATTQAGIATTQAGTATTQAGIATTQAGIATTQAGIATTQAGTATTQAGIATTQASNSAASALTASTGASTATTQAGIATTQAGIATTQAGNAATSASNALASLNTFKGQYYGSLASDPVLDPLGAAIGTGDLYFNTTVPEMRVYNGSAWVAAYISGAGLLSASSNLSDVASPSTSRTNLGLGTIATQDADDVALTGGTADGVEIGTTTPSSGAFTTLTDSYGNVRDISKSGAAKTASYTLLTTDIGQFIEVGSGGSVTIPDATFSTGDAVSVFNNTSGNITITCSITTAYIGGTDSDKATVTLATRGVATILFISGTVCVINGNVT